MNIGFVSTRLAGIDGVSLEAAKWAAVLRRMGHQVFYCAGELEADGPPGTLISELHFRDPEAEWINRHAFGTTTAHPDLRDRIEGRAAQLKEALRAFIAHHDIQLIIPENALAIPMQIPLGIALADLIAETGIPTIAHHHDFHWERERFWACAVPDVLERAFPPDLPSIRHVVINSLAQRALAGRRGIEAMVIPNVFDFEASPPGVDDFNRDLREAIGLGEDDLFFLQPTRVVPRKGIELAIELVSRLQIANCKLVITHRAGDEGMGYLRWLGALADKMGVDLRYVADRVGATRSTTPGGDEPARMSLKGCQVAPWRAGSSGDEQSRSAAIHRVQNTIQRDCSSGEKIYSLWDAYVHADFVTYPSLYEGFGNALLEAVYFRKPVLVNRYPVYAADIGPKGFDFIEIEGKVTDEAVAEVWHILTDPERRQAAVERNFRLGEQHFSYRVLEGGLQELLASF